jgi:hypothetical protein
MNGSNNSNAYSEGSNMAKRRKRRKKSGQLGFRDRVAIGLSLKIALSLAVIVVFLSLVQCTINKPEAPTWTSQFTVPLIDKQYDMPELIQRIDEPTLTLDSSGNPFFSIQQDLDSVGVNASMTVADITQSVGDVVGLISITPDAIPPLTVAFSDIIAFPPGLIPPAPMDIVYDGPVITSFQSATFNGGFVRTIVENNLGVYLDTVKIDLVDLTSFLVIGSGEFIGGLPIGARDTLIIPLDGKTVGNRLRMQVHGHTPGGTILTLSGKNIMLEMSISDPLIIESGTAVIPEITKNFSQKSGISSPHVIRNATLESGSLSLSLNNSTALAVDMTISIPDLQLAGVPLTVIDTLNGNTSKTINLDVSGYSLIPADIVAPQELDIQIIAHIPTSSPSAVTVNSTDSLTATATLSNVAFSSVQGVFNAITTTFAPIAASIAVPNGFDSAQFTAATMTLDIDNASGLSGSLNINVLGSNGKSITINGQIAAGSATTPITTTITNSNLSDFLNPIPSSYTVSGSVSFGDGVTVTDITKSDYVTSRVTISSPLEVVFNGSTVQLDVQSTSIDTSSIDIITEHLQSATINATVTNHLPSGIEVYLYLSSDSATIYTAPEVTIGPITVAAGQVDGSGITIASTISNSVITVDSADAQVLKNSRIYIGELLTLASSGGQPIRFMGADFVDVKAHVIIDYLINDNF